VGEDGGLDMLWTATVLSMSKPGGKTPWTRGRPVS
jgi:hypothetical protein